jgi:hypothetical protein
MGFLGRSGRFEEKIGDLWHAVLASRVPDP